MPLSDNGNFPQDASTYEVLGRVELSGKAGRTGYTKLYEKAKELYPEADDVVNIKVDVKKRWFLFWPLSGRYEFSGIAIKYK